MARHVGEVAVRLGVQTEDFDIVEASPLEHRANRRSAYAMQWRVNDLQFARTGRRLLEHGVDKRRVDFFLANLNAAIGQRFFERHPRDFFHRHHAIDHALVVRRQELSARGPVGLHGIVAGRVVASGNHDAAGAVLEPYRKRQLGRATVAFQEVDLDTRRHHDFGAELGEVIAAMPGVVGNGTGQIAGVVVLLRIVGQALGTLADGAIVNRIGANGVHPPAASAGAKGNDRPEGVVERLPLALLNMLGHLGGVLRIAGFGEPVFDVVDRRFRNLAVGRGLLDLAEDCFVGHLFFP